MANSAIMNEASIDTVETNVNRFAEEVEQFEQCIDKTLQYFEDEQIVQTFFQSGNFGENEKEKLMKIRDAVIKYRENLESNLMTATKQYVREQESLLASGNY